MILNGSGRKNGNTAAMIKAFTEGAGTNGNEVREFFLQTMNIHGCLNCRQCAEKEKGIPYPCVQQDDMEKIIPVFREADVIVFASPVYFWDITGTLKTAADRLYAVYKNDRETFNGKGCVLLLVSGGSTEEHMLDWYKNYETRTHWHSYGTALNDTEEARRIGERIR